jgi:L-fuconolactonase
MLKQTLAGRGAAPATLLMLFSAFLVLLPIAVATAGSSARNKVSAQNAKNTLSAQKKVAVHHVSARSDVDLTRMLHAKHSVSGHTATSAVRYSTKVRVEFALAFSSTPPASTTSSSAKIAWTATGASHIRCALDQASSASCSSPATYQGVGLGAHTFKVTASRNSLTKTISTSWTVVAPAPAPSVTTTTSTSTSTTTTTTRVDAHQHFWRVADQDQPWRSSHHGAIARDFLPEDLTPSAAEVGVSRTVLVQSVDEPAENDRLAAFAEHPLVAGVVAWAPLDDPVRARQELDRVPIAKLAGVRCLVGKGPLPWLEDPQVRALLADLADRGVAWDVVPVTAGQTASVLRLAQALPALRIVIDHLGRPPVETGGWDPWAQHLDELAGCPNVAVKLSVGLDVLTAWPRWSARELRPYVVGVCDRFGPARVMLASNWPVVTLRAGYQQAWGDVEAVVRERYAGADLARVLGGTAARWYGLDQAVCAEGGGTRAAP